MSSNLAGGNSTFSCVGKYYKATLTACVGLFLDPSIDSMDF